MTIAHWIEVWARDRLVGHLEEFPSPTSDFSNRMKDAGYAGWTGLTCRARIAGYPDHKVGFGVELDVPESGPLKVLSGEKVDELCGGDKSKLLCIAADNFWPQRFRKKTETLLLYILLATLLVVVVGFLLNLLSAVYGS